MYTPAIRARLSRIEAVRAAAEQAGEPLLRFRKVNGILNALAVQIEDGSDDPVVVAHLLDRELPSKLLFVGSNPITRSSNNGPIQWRLNYFADSAGQLAITGI